VRPGWGEGGAGRPGGERAAARRRGEGGAASGPGCWLGGLGRAGASSPALFLAPAGTFVTFFPPPPGRRVDRRPPPPPPERGAADPHQAMRAERRRLESPGIEARCAGTIWGSIVTPQPRARGRFPGGPPLTPRSVERRGAPPDLEQAPRGSIGVTGAPTGKGKCARKSRRRAERAEVWERLPRRRTRGLKGPCAGCTHHGNRVNEEGW